MSWDGSLGWVDLQEDSLTNLEEEYSSFRKRYSVWKEGPDKNWLQIIPSHKTHASTFSVSHSWPNFTVSYPVYEVKEIYSKETTSNITYQNKIPFIHRHDDEMYFHLLLTSTRKGTWILHEIVHFYQSNCVDGILKILMLSLVVQVVQEFTRIYKCS